MPGNESEIQKVKIQLLLEAIKDGQSIIARLDSKAKFYLAILLAIAGGFVTLGKYLIGLYFPPHSLKIISVLIILFLSGLLIWAIFLIVLLIDKIVSPRSNPIDKISFDEKPMQKTLFFPISRNGRFSYSEYKKELQEIESLKGIEKILLIENLKVAAIRDEKINSMHGIEKGIKCLFYAIIFAAVICVLVCLCLLCRFLCGV